MADRQMQHSTRGVTLIELIITIGILTIVLGGIYGLLKAAYDSYNHTRARLESQQTARIVMDYLVFRLREIDGGRSTGFPNNCGNCHTINQDGDTTTDHPLMPCTQDVSIPQVSPDILEFRKVAFAPLADVPAVYQGMTGNFIRFKADLLPLHGFNEAFTDSNGEDAAYAAYDNDRWDWIKGNAAFDTNQDSLYDPNEAELLDDINDNDRYDYYGETWTLTLRKPADRPYYELVESVNFDSLQPRPTPGNNPLYNRSAIPAEGYTDIPVAYGITGLRVVTVPRLPDPAAYSQGVSVGLRTVQGCFSGGTAGSAPLACHGADAMAADGVTPRPDLNIYGSATSMQYEQFVSTRHWRWNIAGFNVEVCTVDTKGSSQPQYTRLRELVNLRNVEANQ